MIFIDTNVLVSSFIDEDATTARTMDFFSKFSKFKLCTSTDVIAETLNFLTNKVNSKLAYIVGKKLLSEKLIKIIEVTNNDRDIALELIKIFSDYKLSFVDATSFALIHKFKIKQVYSYDADFNLLKGVENLAFSG